eukprot:28166-Amphidinium_carterae.1
MTLGNKASQVNALNNNGWFGGRPDESCFRTRGKNAASANMCRQRSDTHERPISIIWNHFKCLCNECGWNSTMLSRKEKHRNRQTPASPQTIRNKGFGLRVGDRAVPCSVGHGSERASKARPRWLPSGPPTLVLPFGEAILLAALSLGVGV